MRKESKLLLAKAINSVRLCIEMFNRPWEDGRADSVLINLTHGFEMLLKSIIVERGGRIWDEDYRHTIGFETCVRKCLTDGICQCINQDQAATLRTIDSLRDAAYHYTVSLSEDELYLHTQAGVTLFSDLLREVFRRNLGDFLPSRVLPVSTSPPQDLIPLFEEQFELIKGLVSRGKRQRLEARNRLMAIARMENALAGRDTAPSQGELNRALGELASGKSWREIFPGVARIKLDTSGTGLTVNLRFSKDPDALPVRTVPEGDPAAQGVVAVKRVNELDFYQFGLRKLADKIGLSSARTLAIVRELGIQDDPRYYKEITIGKSRHKLYSQEALRLLRERLPTLDVEAVWDKHRLSMTRSRATFRKVDDLRSAIRR